MGTVQLATRIDESQNQVFRETTKRLGITPADAMRVFVAAFNLNRGFPFDVRLVDEPEPFENEEDAMDFASRMSMRMADEEG